MLRLLVLALLLPSCLHVEWVLDRELRPGQVARVVLVVRNGCGEEVRLRYFRVRAVAVSVLGRDFRVSLSLMTVQLPEERVVGPGETSRAESRRGIPWFVPPGEYVLELVCGFDVGEYSTVVRMRVRPGLPHYLALAYALTFIALAVLVKAGVIRVRVVREDLGGDGAGPG